MPVVVAVLIDNFTTAVRIEKEAGMSAKLQSLITNAETHSLDPLLRTFMNCQSKADLRKRIQNIFKKLDVDNSGGLTHQEVYEGLRKMNFVPPIKISNEEFHSLTQDRRVCNEKGELDLPAFEKVMIRQMKLFAERQLGQMTVTTDDHTATMMLGIKILLFAQPDTNAEETVEVKNQGKDFNFKRLESAERKSPVCKTIDAKRDQIQTPLMRNSIMEFLDNCSNLVYQCFHELGTNNSHSDHHSLSLHLQALDSLIKAQKRVVSRMNTPTELQSERVVPLTARTVSSNPWPFTPRRLRDKSRSFESGAVRTFRENFRSRSNIEMPLASARSEFRHVAEAAPLDTEQELRSARVSKRSASLGSIERSRNPQQGREEAVEPQSLFEDEVSRKEEGGRHALQRDHREEFFLEAGMDLVSRRAVHGGDDDPHHCEVKEKHNHSSNAHPPPPAKDVRHSHSPTSRRAKAADGSHSHHARVSPEGERKELHKFNGQLQAWRDRLGLVEERGKDSNHKTSHQRKSIERAISDKRTTRLGWMLHQNVVDWWWFQG
eukprot:768380-Hanusia_phi.AAC.5